MAENLNGANDVEIAKNLMEKDILSKSEIDAAFSRQITEILKTALSWQEGEWVFSPLARAKENMRCKMDVYSLLMEYGRSLPEESIIRHFRSFTETFGLRPELPAHINLLPKESFVLSRFENSFIKVEEIKALSGLTAGETLQVLYTLWLGGFLYRQNWSAAFSDRKISDILSANLTLKKQDDLPPKVTQPEKAAVAPPVIKEAVPVQPKPGTPKPSEPKITLEKYLDQAEGATNHYETLGVQPDAAAADVKRAYFAFARQFHPDLYYKNVASEVHQRIQNAFTKVAHAYDTLRDEESRKVYDFKLQKELEYQRQVKKDDLPAGEADLQKQATMAAESFEIGFKLLAEEYYEESLPHLGRAVHLASKNPRYHAFYGKALSFDESQRYKAEAEMQLAIKLEPNNAIFRIILAEVFIHYGLLKRAEGELRRLLAIHPNNREAMALLDSLQ